MPPVDAGSARVVARRCADQHVGVGLTSTLSSRALDRAFVCLEWVAGFAHELETPNVALAAIGLRLREDERAVDLTATALGYQDFVGAAEVTRRVELGWSILSTASAAAVRPRHLGRPGVGKPCGSAI